MSRDSSLLTRHRIEVVQAEVEAIEDDGRTMLALFQGEPQGARPPVGFRRVAFRVDGRGFLTFLTLARRG